MCKHNNFHVVHNALDVKRVDELTEHSDRAEARSEFELAPDDVYCLLPGTVCERKGQIDIIDALVSMNGDCPKNLRVGVAKVPQETWQPMCGCG